ncbi:MAG: hypothetical protein NW220_14125 [Leptolyngbyaceae cyanobacterium bins.349]|nr:hypothetical protein [Leptolyngbyaceae cyanobacterium bins.349]
MSQTISHNAISLNALGHSMPISQHTFEPGMLSAIPETAQQYLTHAIALTRANSSALLWIRPFIVKTAIVKC